ncbi:unnamed protein product [Pieris brassicae]|uniref:Uncharacterized protein n=1 Tax=Pieris brassicae TaxID=7116 RepID=A0A9P0XCN2_PIEBR|nr:unnamed protein product [Pieris brassicae]
MSVQQLQIELQNELVTMNQLSQLITSELRQIKELTNPGGELENNVKQNVSLMKELATLKNINLSSIPPFDRLVQNNLDSNQNLS